MTEATIKIKQANESAFSVTIDLSSTVLQLKQKIEADGPGNVPTTQQRLIFAGKVLKDEDKLDSYKMTEGNTVHMVKGSSGARSAAAASATASSATASSTAASATTNPAGAGAANPFNMFGGGATAGAGGNPFAAFGGGGMGGGMSAMDPSMMAGLLNNPAVAQSISQMMSNPQMLDQLTAMNPGMASMITPQVREMMGSEEFRRIMSDPNMMRSMMQMGPMMSAMNGGGGMGGMGGGNPMAGMFGAGANSPGAPGAGAPGLNPALLQSLMGSMGGMGAGAAPPQDSRPPEERFATQLQQLQEMGFYDATENVRALTLTHGNVQAAVEWLFSHPPGGAL
ncbi:hypothetical protein DFS34DRAFT_617014 [Phlyctochytrium arcticum]|nr:hypothetical protein DFS34DRAFT_617014 [Phlyctochytrium arcticum]